MKKKSRARCVVKVARWTSYAVAGAATAIAANNDAEGAILYSGVLNTPVPFAGGTAAIKTLLANSLQGTQVLGKLYHKGYGASNRYGIAAFTMHPTAQARGFVHLHYFYNSYFSHGLAARNYASRLAPSANIAAGPFLAAGSSAPMARLDYSHSSSRFRAKLTGAFLGFEFNLGGGEQYGWVRVDMSGPRGNSITLDDYAYGTVGQAITAGQTATPEPASLGLLAIGAAGLLAMRKGRRQKKAEPTAATA